jgi:hypothetical protein
MRPLFFAVIVLSAVVLPNGLVQNAELSAPPDVVVSTGYRLVNLLVL